MPELPNSLRVLDDENMAKKDDTQPVIPLAKLIEEGKKKEEETASLPPEDPLTDGEYLATSGVFRRVALWLLHHRH